MYFSHFLYAERQMNENNEQAKRQLQSGWLWVQNYLLVAMKLSECQGSEAQAVS